MEANQGKDLIRRFTRTPHSANLQVMGHTIRLETNSTEVLDPAREVFGAGESNPDVAFEFLWKIVVDPSSGLSPPWPERVAFSDEGIRYINLGQRSFIAVDLSARQAVGVLSEGLAKDPSGIRCPFFSNLLNLSSPSLGLTEIAAACVARGRKCLLIFGPPKSGKTTSAYLATRFGLRFHADQELFLEFGIEGLIAWGDPWPAIFRLDVLDRHPEIGTLARPFNYRDLSFLYVDRHLIRPKRAYAARPTCCVFLERERSDRPTLSALPPESLAERLRAYFPFIDDEVFEPRRAAVESELANLPSYRLAYGADPYQAACVYRGLLNGSLRLERSACESDILATNRCLF